MLTDQDLRELGVLESDTHLEGMQRYSEFSKFHGTLMSSSLAKHIKGEVLHLWLWVELLFQQYLFACRDQSPRKASLLEHHLQTAVYEQRARYNCDYREEGRIGEVLAGLFQGVKSV